MILDDQDLTRKIVISPAMSRRIEVSQEFTKRIEISPNITSMKVISKEIDQDYSNYPRHGQDDSN